MTSGHFLLKNGDFRPKFMAHVCLFLSEVVTEVNSPLKNKSEEEEEESTFFIFYGGATSRPTTEMTRRRW